MSFIKSDSLLSNIKNVSVPIDLKLSDGSNIFKSLIYSNNNLNSEEKERSIKLESLFDYDGNHKFDEQNKGNSLVEKLINPPEAPGCSSLCGGANPNDSSLEPTSQQQKSYHYNWLVCKNADGMSEEENGSESGDQSQQHVAPRYSNKDTAIQKGNQVNNILNNSLISGYALNSDHLQSNFGYRNEVENSGFGLLDKSDLLGGFEDRSALRPSHRNIPKVSTNTNLQSDESLKLLNFRSRSKPKHADEIEQRNSERNSKKSLSLISLSLPAPEQSSNCQQPSNGINESSEGFVGSAKIKNETKNIPKNYGKAIICFIERYQDKVFRITQSCGVSYSQLLDDLRRRKKTINTIADLRNLWSDYKYARCMRIISFVFFRKHALSYIFDSRICTYGSHIKYRQRLCEAVSNPRGFKHIKDF